MNSATITPPSPEPPSRRHDALPRGSRLGELEVERVIADSSFAIVYLANEPGSARRYTIKEYLPLTLARRGDDFASVVLRAPQHAGAFERGLLAFSAEAQLFERCNHPALLRVLRCWQAHGTVYRLMPYLHGDSLLALRRAMTAPPDDAALRRLLFALLGGLQALHDTHHHHGDVSAGNIMLLSDDRPVLLDTGAVRRALVGEQTRALMAQIDGGALGSGPLEPDGDQVGAAADVHALAAVAHFCISGRLPSGAAGFEPLLPAPGNAATAEPTFSASLLGAIDTALSGSAEQRPHDVAHFRAALAGTPTSPRLAPGYRRHRRRSRLGWWLAGVLVTVALVATPWLLVRHFYAAPPAMLDRASPAAPPAPLASTRRRTGRAEVNEVALQPPRASPPPAALAPSKPALPPKATAAVRKLTSPRELCAGRADFALYRCMQTECRAAKWSNHAQCKHLRETDSVD